MSLQYAIFRPRESERSFLISVLMTAIKMLFFAVLLIGITGGGVLAGVVVLLTKPSILIVYIIFTVVLQQLDGNVIKPLLFGDSSGLSPFWVLVAIIVGGRMFGVLGMVLGVPVCALIFSIYEDILNRRIRMKSERRPTEDNGGE